MIGEWIKTEREAKEMNRKQFAEKTGVSYNTIKAIEEGSNGGTFAVVEKLVEGLDYELILMRRTKDVK